MYKSKEEKRVEHMAVGMGIAAAASAVGGIALLEQSHDKTNHPMPITPIEKVGGHHGSAEMPSGAHLKQFTAEQGITINSK